MAKILKKDNKEMREKLMAKKGFSKEDAEEMAPDEYEDDGKDGDKDDEARKALAMLKVCEDQISKGLKLFTKDEVDAIIAKHDTEMDGLMACVNESTEKVRDRLGNVEKAIGAFSAIGEKMIAAMDKAAAATAEHDVVVKAMKLKLDDPDFGKLNGAPVDKSKGQLEEINSPHDENGATVDDKVVTRADFVQKAAGLLKRKNELKLAPDVVKRLAFALADGEVGESLPTLKFKYPEIFTDKAA